MIDDMQKGAHPPEALTYSRTVRCECGAGMAYVHASDGRGGQGCSPMDHWCCGDVLRGFVPEGKEPLHSIRLPFWLYCIHAEPNKKAGWGNTTRPGEN